MPVVMANLRIHEVNTLPSTEVVDNDFILKRFTVDMLAEGIKESSIKAYLDVVRPFLDHTGISFINITSERIS